MANLLNSRKNLVAGLLAVTMVLFAALALLPAPANAAGIHPCRNWDRSPLTTAKLQQALRDFPQCGKVWARLTKAPGGKVRPEDYVVKGRRGDIKPGDRIINTGVTTPGNLNYYKWTVKPGTTFVDIQNTATAVAATAKEDCLNPAAKAPRQVVERLPQMVTLTAWAKAEATSRAHVDVKMRYECPGSTTTVTVKVWVYAHSKAAATAKARTEQARANVGRPSASVWAQATATARTKLNISIVVACKLLPVAVTPPPPVVTPPPPPVAQYGYLDLRKVALLDGNPFTTQTVLVDVVCRDAAGTVNYQRYAYPLVSTGLFSRFVDGTNVVQLLAGSACLVTERPVPGWTTDVPAWDARITAGEATAVTLTNRRTSPPPPVTPPPPPPPCVGKACDLAQPTQTPTTPTGGTGQGPNPPNTGSGAAGGTPATPTTPSGGTPGGGLTPCPPGYTGTYPNCS